MSDKKIGDPRLGFGRALSVAAVTGLAAGALFAIQDTLRACKSYPWWHLNYAPGLDTILAMACRAMAWYAAAGCALALLVGVGAWAVARVHGYRLDAARVAALCLGAFAFAVLSAGVKGLLSSEIAGAAFLCAVGFGCAAYVAGRWSGGPARLAAAAAGLVAAFFVYSCWTQWLVRLKPMKASGPAAKLGQWAVAALAVVLGVAVYRLGVALLQRRKRATTNDGMTNDESMPNAECRTPTAGPEGSAPSAVPASLAPRPSSSSFPIRHSSFRHSSFVIWLLVALACLAALGAGSWAIQPARARWAPSAEPNTRPNIVWLVLDTARRDAFSCYGEARKTTPHIDALAAEGALFERAFAPAPWTIPSHASMFTGLLPSRHGATGEELALRDGLPTIAEVLAQHGYATFACSANLYVSQQPRMTRGFQRVHVLPWGREPDYALALEQVRRGLHLTDDGAAAINPVALRWIDEAHEANRPFLLFVNYMEAHLEYGSTPYLARWLPRGVSLRRALRISQNAGNYIAGTVTPAPKDFEILRALYEADLTYLDERVGELVAHLRRRGLLDNTLLIITSDHGEELGEHGYVGHMFGIHNTLLRIPLILRYPPRFQPGARREDLAELMDLFPTVLDVAGVDWAGRAGLDGRSLLTPPRLEAEQLAVAQRDVVPTWLGSMIRKHPAWDAVPSLNRLMCIQDRHFLYRWASDDTAELFDLTRDPLGKQNVVGRFPQEAARLRAALEARVGRLRPGVSAAAMARAAQRGGGTPSPHF